MDFTMHRSERTSDYHCTHVKVSFNRSMYQSETSMFTSAKTVIRSRGILKKNYSSWKMENISSPWTLSHKLQMLLLQLYVEVAQASSCSCASCITVLFECNFTLAARAVVLYLEWKRFYKNVSIRRNVYMLTGSC